MATDDKTKPILPTSGDVPTKDRQSVSEAGPPIDDQVCIKKPPTTGRWYCDAVDGVIQNPANPWLQH